MEESPVIYEVNPNPRPNLQETLRQSVILEENKRQLRLEIRQEIDDRTCAQCVVIGLRMDADSRPVYDFMQRIEALLETRVNNLFDALEML